MPRRILVPLDVTYSARRALGAGATLAKQMEARLEVVVVKGRTFPSVDPKEAWGLAASIPCRLDGVETIMATHRDRALADIASDPDVLLCVASHGRNALGELVFGSVSSAVVREATAPVVLVGPNCPDQPSSAFRNLVVGVDGEGPDSLRLLPEILRWPALGLQPWLVQVVACHLPDDAPADVVDAAGLRELAGVLQASGLSPEWEVLHCRRADSRHVARAIVAFGDKIDDAVGLVAIHGRKGLSHLALGSVSLDLVHHASWPVLIIPPHGQADDVRP